MKIIRVFPRKTKATPDDENVRINCPPGLFDEADEIHVSATFTWDLPRAEQLAEQWSCVAPVKVGGPATGERGGDFTPGMYLKRGYVITSRGCPNNCWFCSVPKREGGIRELPITEGWNVLDDNLLACSGEHIMDVFSMLSFQKHPVEFTGGLEAARLKWEWVEILRDLRIKQMFFAYDEPGDYVPLLRAAEALKYAGVKLFPESHAMRCYVLCGYRHDSLIWAEDRMKSVLKVGFMPMAMLWRDEAGESSYEWRKFQREWARPAIICSRERK